MASQAPYRKKLIEVALPLEAINVASAREKSIRHGHPSTLHLWWARRPLAACRAVLFSSIVDDPSSLPELFPTAEAQDAERQRLFRIIEQLVIWENSNDEAVLHTARTEIARSVARTQSVELPRKMSRSEVEHALRQYAPPVLDPFCGGGSIPLEAQRLGLEAHGSDLNPVAVLITKALIEIPPKFANMTPVNPEERRRGVGAGWKGSAGLAADVRYYGKWMRDEAEKRIGHLYPKVTLPSEQGGGEATVIAWLWARTVTCPNPACGAQMPLVRSFALSTKKDKQVWVDPVIDHLPPGYHFVVKTGTGDPREGTVNRRGATCIVCGSAVPFEHVRSEGRAGRMSERLMAVVVEGAEGRVYLPPIEHQMRIASSVEPRWVPDAVLPHNPRDFKTPNYGMRTFADLFARRQLVALTTFSDLVSEARERVYLDAVAAVASEDHSTFGTGVTGAGAYSDAVATYLALAVDKGANLWSTITSWMGDRGALRETFARQAIPMVWDYAEANPFSDSGGNILQYVERVADVLGSLPIGLAGNTVQFDAAVGLDQPMSPIFSTDPPYYDNIGYADLSDFFYVWLRHSIAVVHPDLFSTLLTPKAQELIASPYRHGGSKTSAEQFFETGLGRAFARMRQCQHQEYPLTVFYAFKQSEADRDVDGSGTSATSSTGWETMLEALLGAGFTINGTMPMRTEGSGRILARGTNALASSIVLVCRPRPESSKVATRSEFVRAVKYELPDALRLLQHGNIAPVDLAQAAIGPGMAVFSRYSQVLEPSGEPMRVRTALQLINQTLDEVLTEQEGEFDTDTRWAVAWFDQYGLKDGPYGVAEILSSAKNTSVDGLRDAGFLKSGAGKVRLLSRDELNPEWNPQSDHRPTVWEATQHLIRLLEQSESAAADLLTRLGDIADAARDLSYRLYHHCERKHWTEEALAYNSLVVAWPELQRLAAEMRTNKPQQARLV